jgi:hypothetical protein
MKKVSILGTAIRAAAHFKRNSERDEDLRRNIKKEG